MFLTNKTRLKIKNIVKRIAEDEKVSLEERIYVEKFAKHNSTIWTWLKKANSLRRYGKQNSDGINGCLLYTSPSPRDKRQSRMPSSA